MMKSMETYTGDRTSTAEMSETDYAVFDALADDPRRPWSDVAQLTGLSAVTARRKWQRMVERGAAWVTTHPGFGSGAVYAHVEVQCAPGATESVAARLGAHPRILSVTEVTGDYNLFLVVAAEDIGELRRILQLTIGGSELVRGVRSSVINRVYSDGSTWRAGALPGSRSVSAPPAPVRPGIADPRARTVLGVLEPDGRAPTTAVAEALGTSEAHARRFVKETVRTGTLVQRIDLSLEHSDWPHGLALHMVAPAHSLDASAARIRSMPGTRLCTAISGGPYNLYVVVWLHTLEEAVEVEKQLVSELDVTVANRSILLHYHKRMGHLFDADRRRIGHVSWLGEEG